MSRTNLPRAMNAVGRSETRRIIDLPIFLCPAFVTSRYPFHMGRTRCHGLKKYSIKLIRPRYLHSQSLVEMHKLSTSSHTKLPQQCPGCGAFSQNTNGQLPGFYSLKKSVKPPIIGGFERFLNKRQLEGRIIEQTLQNVESKVLESFITPGKLPQTIQKTEAPLCNRCHNLIHHKSGVSIKHPSIESIQRILSESPHKYNHIYHIIDAADFPLSLIPQLHKLLDLPSRRSRNRRSKTGKFYHGKKNELSFIITRSDLLAPLKSQVDSLMPYLTSVLRDKLSLTGKHIRLGNVRCISAQRGWWTKELKEEIWNRGGGGWMVGKVNVGKSQLFESVFPKGRRGMVAENISPKTELTQEPLILEDLENSFPNWSQKKAYHSTLVERNVHRVAHDGALSLLPPIQPEVDYPVMPIVSPLPGTTASPIRVSFGNGRGELVDLPGLSRGDLEHFIQDCHRSSLVMRSRVKPEQQVIKPGQSLLLGGVIRITPKTADLIFLSYSFNNLSLHLTSTIKAMSVQSQERQLKVENIGNPGIGDSIKSAGVFQLRWDVTKMRSGPVTSRNTSGILVDKLPYRVFSTDIVIEGCGWVELVVQVQKRVIESPAINTNNSPFWPEVEVFSPEGRFISARRPLGAWLLSTPRKIPATTKKRPRRSMQGIKKRIREKSI